MRLHITWVIINGVISCIFLPLSYLFIMISIGARNWAVCFFSLISLYLAVSFMTEAALRCCLATRARLLEKNSGELISKKFPILVTLLVFDRSRPTSWRGSYVLLDRLGGSNGAPLVRLLDYGAKDAFFDELIALHKLGDQRASMRFDLDAHFRPRHELPFLLEYEGRKIWINDLPSLRLHRFLFKRPWHFFVRAEPGE